MVKKSKQKKQEVEKIERRGRPQGSKSRVPDDTVILSPNHWTESAQMVDLLGDICQFGAIQQIIDTGKRANNKINKLVREQQIDRKTITKKQQKGRKKMDDEMKEIVKDATKMYEIQGHRAYFFIKQLTEVPTEQHRNFTAGNQALQQITKHLNTLAPFFEEQFTLALQTLLDNYGFIVTKRHSHAAAKNEQRKLKVITRWIRSIKNNPQIFKELLACQHIKLQGEKLSQQIQEQLFQQDDQTENQVTGEEDSQEYQLTQEQQEEQQATDLEMWKQSNPLVYEFLNKFYKVVSRLSTK